MQVILLEKVRNLGVLGDKVVVKAGYARNYLIPQQKAVLATVSNIEKFEARRRDLEAREKELLVKAQQRAEQLTDKIVTIDVKAGDEGKLYGSIGTKDIAQAITEVLGVAVEKNEIDLPEGTLRRVGEFVVTLQLHSDVSVAVTLNLNPVE